MFGLLQLLDQGRGALFGLVLQVEHGAAGFRCMLLDLGLQQQFRLGEVAAILGEFIMSCSGEAAMLWKRASMTRHASPLSTGEDAPAPWCAADMDIPLNRRRLYRRLSVIQSNKSVMAH
ncbi:hypothetical protein [Azotobacter salinestris]|uniref:hypothetical protein n=1 Tax=Azotobacter salinestris TaxID=69964 RepID=UPI0032DF9C80